MISYWDMAASLVTTGAIDAEAFLAAHHEVVATFSKVQPFLTEVRAAIGEPHFCHHLEQVGMSLPDAEAVMDRRREKIRSAARAKTEAPAAKVALKDAIEPERPA